jgi:hypothetical protein
MILALFCSFLQCQIACLWPGRKGRARKKHRREGNPWRRSAGVSAEGGRRTGAPTTDNLGSRRKNGLPARAEKRHLPWFFRALPLPPGLAMLEIRLEQRLLGEK